MKFNKIKRIKSFTLVELVIALLLSGIVISLVGSTYTLIKRSIVRSTQDYEFDNQVMSFSMALKHDFDKAEVISKHDNIITIIFPPNEIIKYQFGDSIFIRQASDMVDSFLLWPANIQIKTLKANIELVKEIYLQIQLKDIDYPIHLYKEYSKDLLFQMDHRMR